MSREHALIEDLSLALVREYLAKKKYKSTLETLATELVRTNTQTRAEVQTKQSRPANSQCLALCPLLPACLLVPSL